MTATEKTRRFFPRGQQIHSICQPDFEPATAIGPEHYPLVEIVRDHLCYGSWLYLHPSPAGSEGTPTFVPDGESLTLKASMILTSYYMRHTPITGPAPAKTATVYTAADHLNR